MLGFAVAHIGINETGESAAKKTSGLFTALFGFKQKETDSFIFAGDAIEVMKSAGPGINGHIAIRTNYLTRAVAYLRRRGIEFRRDSEKYDDSGRMKAIYLENEIGGFAVHLVQK
jgi:2-dehydro-3-deoxyphosphogluconate aldolase/(4S)-4-hydroxy-2-oxoglutarate aldolase